MIRDSVRRDDLETKLSETNSKDTELENKLKEASVKIEMFEKEKDDIKAELQQRENEIESLKKDLQKLISDKYVETESLKEERDTKEKQIKE